MITAHEEFKYVDKENLWYDFYSSWSMPYWIFIDGEKIEYQNKMLGVYL